MKICFCQDITYMGKPFAAVEKTVEWNLPMPQCGEPVTDLHFMYDMLQGYRVEEVKQEESGSSYTVKVEKLNMEDGCQLYHEFDWFAELKDWKVKKVNPTAQD